MKQFDSLKDLIASTEKDAKAFIASGTMQRAHTTTKSFTANQSVCIRIKKDVTETKDSKINKDQVT